MRIACLSGKGGAGKTFAAVSLAAAAGDCTYIDCDVEEPNGRLFLKPENVEKVAVTKLLPSFDPERCTGCRECVDACRFNALLYIKGTPRIFDEMCHSCGLCRIVCSREAITEVEKEIGALEIGTHGDIKVVTGILNPGEASGVGIINQAVKQSNGLTILDCPPGSACSVVESIMDADYCVLVVEPTAFGFHNFQMVHELATLLEKPCGVIINKQSEPYEPLEAFCREHELPVLERFAYDPELAKHLADSEVAAESIPEIKERFRAVLKTIGGSI